MCCFLTVLLFFGPRLAIIVWWLAQRLYVEAAFDNWIFPIIGWIFLPWTTLLYIAVYPGGIVGFDFVMLALGILLDVASYSGGAWGNRRRIGR